MEEEVRRLLTEATREDTCVEETAYERMRRHFEEVEADLELPERSPGRAPPDLR